MMAAANTGNNNQADNIMEDIAERESLRGDDEFDDAASSLSKELLIAK